MQNETISVVIAGINGRMGRASAQAIAAASGFNLVGAVGKEGALYVGKRLDELVGVPLKSKTGILVSSDLSDCLEKTSPNVLLDFTEADNACAHAIAALKKNVRPVIGTSGLTSDHLKQIEQSCNEHKLGALVVPNFSVGAILMMHFAKQASCLFDHVEVVEMHHTRKIDAPSGTAMRTAEMIGSTGRTFNPHVVAERELIAGARGAKTSSGLRLHSVRLPGLLSHQEVLFGAEGELMTIRHDSFNTKCFEKGILLSLQAVRELNNLVIGLDSLVLAKL